MSLFPMFLKLEGRRCLVVGAGHVASSKIESLLAAGADLTVVAPRTVHRIDEWIRQGRLSWVPHEFLPDDLEGVFLVIGATAREEIDAAVYLEASKRGILCNVVDDPVRCDFYFPAVVRRGDLQIAISTGGQSPALAMRLRRELEAQFGPQYKDWLLHLGNARRRLLEMPMDAERRLTILHDLASPEGLLEFLSEHPSIEAGGKPA